MSFEVSSDWYQRFFEAEWLDLAQQWSTEEQTQAEVDFIIQIADLAPGAAVLDLCCGYGRHSIELARRGYRVVGLDISEPSLELARSIATEKGVTVEFIQGDMRHIPYQSEFDLAINLFTAFGYLESDAEDQKVLEAIATALKPGGRLVLDTINQAWLMRHFAPRVWRNLDNGATLLEDRAFDLRTGRVNATWTTIYSDGHRHSLNNSVRAYTLVEFDAKLSAAGLALRQVWGDFEGEPYGLDTSRLILLAEFEPTGA